MGSKDGMSFKKSEGCRSAAVYSQLTARALRLHSAPGQARVVL